MTSSWSTDFRTDSYHCLTHSGLRPPASSLAGVCEAWVVCSGGSAVSVGSGFGALGGCGPFQEDQLALEPVVRAEEAPIGEHDGAEGAEGGSRGDHEDDHDLVADR